MITKDQIKKEVDKLPDSLLEEVYGLLKKIIGKADKKRIKLTVRDFHGQLDNINVRREAHE